MREEEKIFNGTLFSPRSPELREIKLKTHNLCSEYNRTFEDETEKREEIVSKIFHSLVWMDLSKALCISTMESIPRLVI